VLIGSRLKLNLRLMCGLTDFARRAVSRTLILFCVACWLEEWPSVRWWAAYLDLWALC